MSRYTYQNRYTWSHFETIDKYDILFHRDGTVSMFFKWNGVDTALKPQSKINAIFVNLQDALHELDHENAIVIENHFFRQYDNTVCQKYVEYGQKNSTRHLELGQFFRTDQAELISDLAMESEITTVVTISRKAKPIDALFPKKTYNNALNKGKKLVEIAWQFINQLDGARSLNQVEIERVLWAYYDRDKARSNLIPDPNTRYRLSDRIASKPEYESDLIKLGDNYTRVFLFLDYPDAGVNWFQSIASYSGVETHVTQIIRPVDLARTMLKSSSQTKRSAESASVVGGEAIEGKIIDHNTFRKFVNDNDLHTYENAYIVKLHSENADYLKEVSRSFVKILGANTVIAPAREDISVLYWRISQPAQGHRTPFTREDHTLQIANMMPCIRYDEGDTHNRHMLRVTQESKAITLGYPFDGTNHAITIAKTGSGKGVETVAQICELFPLGVNFYGGEVGSSYKWVTEAFGGDYFHLDSHSVISPFPNYDLADDTSEDPLDADVLAPTVDALLPLLGKGAKLDMEIHLRSAAENILLELYRVDHDPDVNAPTLLNFHECTQRAYDFFESDKQKQAVKIIDENLNSFLSSSGKQFRHSDSLNFNSGLVFVDFKKLMNSQELAKFLLVFLSLRFKQLAFANSTPTRIMLDELHEFARIDPELIKVLIQQLTRMGRKEAGAFHGISQETLDVALEKGILNQITHRYFMYLQDGHGEAADKFKMNDSVLSRWEAYKDPEAPGFNLPYRECMRMYGEAAYDLHLKFPQSFLDLAHSSPKALALKEKIGRETTCPRERLFRFRQAMEETA